MTNSRELAKQVEGSLIAADIQFFLDLAFNPHLRPLQGSAMLSLMPFFSSFVIDSAEYLRSNGIASNGFLQPHERLLRTSRLRLKPLEVKDKSFEEILNEITELVEMNSYWFLGSRPVFIRFFQKLFWGDMGVGSLTPVSEHEDIVTAVVAGKHQVEVEDFDFSYGVYADGRRVICFAEGRIGYREWARRNGRLGDIHSLDDRLDHDIDELMA